MPVTENNSTEVEQQSNAKILSSIYGARPVTLKLVQSIIKDPKQLIEGKCLIYQDALKNLVNAEGMLARMPKKNPPSQAYTLHSAKVETLRNICTYLLDITIEHAKTTPELRTALVYLAGNKDDVVLWERMSKAGLKPDAPIVTPERTLVPRNLLHPVTNPNLMKWYADRDAAKQTPSVAVNPNTKGGNSMRQWREEEQKKAELDKDYLQKNLAAQKGLLQTDLDHVNTTRGILGTGNR